MRAKKPFTILKRERKDSVVWVYRVYDDTGKRLEFSTMLDAKKISKTAATAYVAKLYKESRLIPDGAGTGAKQKAFTFESYAKDFFDKDGAFAKRRAKSDSGAYSGNYLAASGTAMKEHFIPAWGRRKLGGITTAEIEDWALARLDEKKTDGTPRYAPKTIRNYLAALGVLYKEAVRTGVVAADPTVAVMLPSKKPQAKRDALRPEEIKRLFAPGTLGPVWQGHDMIRAAALTMLTTGMRIGELRALHGEDVFEGYVHVHRSWSRADGEKSTKSGKPRIVPIPKATQEALKALQGLNGEGILFTLGNVDKKTGIKKPLSDRFIGERLADAFAAIGIDAVEQRARRLSPHALRTTFNSFLIARGANPEKVRAAIGHESEEMTTRYSSFAAGDLTEISDAAAEMLGEERAQASAAHGED